VKGSKDGKAVTIIEGERRLTNAEFHTLNKLPHFVEWLANIENVNTRRAYQADLANFMQFVGIAEPEDFAHVSRAHCIAWRKV